VTLYNNVGIKQFQMGKIVLKGSILFLSCFLNPSYLSNGPKFSLLVLTYLTYLVYKIIFKVDFLSKSSGVLKMFIIFFSILELKSKKLMGYFPSLLKLIFFKKTKPILHFKTNFVFLSGDNKWYPLFKKNSYYGYAKNIKTLNNFFKK
jgi:hypothetical protein